MGSHARGQRRAQHCRYEQVRARAADVSFSCVVKHKDDGQTKFIKPNSLKQDIIIKYWVSIGSIHRE